MLSPLASYPSPITLLTQFCYQFAFAQDLFNVTAGLVGSIDGNPDNDFKSPDGLLLNNVNDFVESCKFGLFGPVFSTFFSKGRIRNATDSLFFHDDPLTALYKGPHTALVALSSLPPESILRATEVCTIFVSTDLSVKRLDDCILDHSLLNDTSNIPRSYAFCSNGCSGGQCIDGECVCFAGWSGPTCSEGICSNCTAEHSTCVNGFCKCKLGWMGQFCEIEGLTSFFISFPLFF